MLNEGSRRQVAELLQPLMPSDQSRVVAAMASVETLLTQPASERTDAVALRPHRAGDIGWVVSANGALYAAEYGWDLTYEALVAKIAAEFIETLDPARERCWIAELDGERVGSVFVVRKTDEIAQLRLLLVEPRARGMGLGARLVDECVAFATQAGYRRMTLWTQSILTAARRIYQRAGFVRVSEAPHHSFGVDLVAETWERSLSAWPNRRRSRSAPGPHHGRRSRRPPVRRPCTSGAPWACAASRSTGSTS
jgi:GNAT superfamily N-acetyltransferase